MKCNLCISQLSAYSDNRLNDKEKREVEDHLRDCPSCQREYEMLREVLEKVGSVEQVDVPEGLHQKIMQQIVKEQKKQKKLFFLQPWVKAVGGLAAVFILVISLMSYDNLRERDKMASELAQPESAKMMIAQEESPSITSEESDEINSFAASDSQHKEQPLLRKSEMAALYEEWQIAEDKKAEVVSAIQTYSQNNALTVMYVPDELDPTEVIIEKIEDKEALLERLREIDHDVQLMQGNEQSDALKISFK